MRLTCHARLLHNQPIRVDPTHIESSVARHDAQVRDVVVRSMKVVDNLTTELDVGEIQVHCRIEVTMPRSRMLRKMRGSLHGMEKLGQPARSSPERSRMVDGKVKER